jgi:hypothetical protein
MNNDTDTVSTCACKKIPEFVAVIRPRSGSYREKREKRYMCDFFLWLMMLKTSGRPVLFYFPWSYSYKVSNYFGES